MNPKELNELVEISRYYGSSKDFVLAGGGNTSFKTESHIWIKASGTSLATIGAEGFVKLSRAALREIETKSYSEDAEERDQQVRADLYRALEDPGNGLRPSVETSLHNLVSYQFVVHLHPWLVNALLCSRNSKKNCAEIFGEDVLYMAYTDPGYTLFMKLHTAIRDYRLKYSRDPQVILLENHGIFVAANQVEEVKAIYDRTLNRIREHIPAFLEISDLPFNPLAAEIMPAIRMLLSGLKLKTVVLRNNTLISHFASSTGEARKIVSPFTPDIIVYCQSKYLYIEHTGSAEGIIESFRHQLDRFRTEFRFDPKIILLKDIGLIAVDDSWKQANTALDVYEDMMKISYYSESFGGQRFLSPDQIAFIDSWEAEHYRKKVAAGSFSGKMEGKTVVVTGGAMGFGKGIASHLFAEKANLVVADIGDEEAEKFVAELNNGQHHNQAYFIHADVSDAESVKNMVQQTVFHFGGIDLFISNAGVLRAGSLEETDPESFEKLTKINYQGYFLCTKYASHVMQIQSKFHPTHFSDIIQINSKSGLRGSNKNFAYAGSKFGGIGLTQSFALELIPYRIKVNAICPGNFFEGPLWSDPKNGLFMQYLRAGKVPGAHSIEDVKKHYESQVPAGRGCRVEDVVKAILYIVEQEYETGQAIPVTGGQVMLG